MCDTSAILGDTFSKLSLPKMGDLEQYAAPALKAAGRSVSAFSEAKEIGKQQGVRMAQIAFGADIEGKQTAQMQERRLGANRAAFAKLGVKQTGTARRLLEEQIKQDEIELLKIRHGRDVGISDAQRQARGAQAQARRTTKGAVAEMLNTKAYQDLFKGLGE